MALWTLVEGDLTHAIGKGYTMQGYISHLIQGDIFRDPAPHGW
ncbi:hypothetical protein SFMTTN_1566 [Sulfuriferula multivorans]|uniref:Uncharacterized protein n=1 Tax=Sulfuriferula multivorans TaxID=1559896 RepID=A0A401JDK6_9PROT|nr:hypothetical protein SFMTTN_1566 [Sulfuriferula multivorans]